MAAPRNRHGPGSRRIAAARRARRPPGVPGGDPRYYSRLGFTPAVEHDFRKPSLRIPDPAFQVVRLSAYEPWMTGTFVYSETFWTYDCVGLRAERQP